MASTLEKLAALYGGNSGEMKETPSWIKHRTHRKGDVLAEIRERNQGHEGVSQVRSERIIEREELLVAATEGVAAHAELFLRENFEEAQVVTKMEHFWTSWYKFTEKYGEDLALGMLELTMEEEFVRLVNHEGYLDKDLVKKQMKIFEKRRKKLAASENL